MAEQLAFDFEWTASKAKGFLSETAAQHMTKSVERDAKMAPKMKILTDEDNEIEISFGERTTTFASRRNDYQIGEHLHLPAFVMFANLLGYKDVKKDPVAHIWHSLKQLGASRPMYFRAAVDPETKDVVVEVGISVHYVDSNKRSRLGSEIFRYWLRTVYSFNTYSKLHRVNLEKSYISFLGSPLFQGSGSLTYTELDQKKLAQSGSMLWPWAIMNEMSSLRSNTWKDARAKAVNLLKGALTLPPGIDFDTSFGSFQNWRFNSNAERKSFASATVVHESLTPMIGMVTGIKSPPASLVKLAAAYLKGADEKNARQDQEIKEITAQRKQEQLDDQRNGRRARWYSGAPARIDYTDLALELVKVQANLVRFYGDASILQQAPTWEEVIASHGTTRSVICTDPTPILSDPYFSSFDRAKQFRMAQAAVIGPASHIRDIKSMLAEMRKKGIDPHEKISPKRVKNFLTLHDEIVKVYNLIKYPEKLVQHRWYEHLINFGMTIPGSDVEFVIPESSNEIRGWGQSQNHCIGSYADGAAGDNPQHLILGIRHKNNNGEWIGHLHTNLVVGQKAPAVLDMNDPNVYQRNQYGYNSNSEPGHVIQFQARQNANVPEPARTAILNHYQAAVRRYFETKELEKTAKAAAKSN